jgi:hypothetical protein
MASLRKVRAYHGSNVRIRRFDSSFSAQGVFWFSEDLGRICAGESGACSIKHVMTVDLTVKKTAGWSEYERLSLWELREAGYDSVLLDEDWLIFDAKNVRVISAT